LDWHRKQFGRPRFFWSIARLSVFDQEVFRHLYEHRVSFDETFQSLRLTFPDITHTRLAESSERIEKELTTSRNVVEAWARLTCSPGKASVKQLALPVHPNIPDPGPNPEAQAVLEERALALRRALGHLPQRERLLIRLRFEQINVGARVWQRHPNHERKSRSCWKSQ